ncbi:hypothetical protein cypCar_00050101, partial [Cyprinus carpio]
MCTASCAPAASSPSATTPSTWRTDSRTVRPITTPCSAPAVTGVTSPSKQAISSWRRWGSPGTTPASSV